MFENVVLLAVVLFIFAYLSYQLANLYTAPRMNVNYVPGYSVLKQRLSQVENYNLTLYLEMKSNLSDELPTG